MGISEYEATVGQAGTAQQPQRRRGKGWMVLLGLLVVGGLLALGIVPRLQQHALLSARQHEVDDGRVAVTVVHPERAPAATEFVLPGNIQAIEETALYARVNGYLHERFVDIGTRVRVAEADVAAARTTVAAQQANVQRLTALRSFQQLVAPFDGIITARAVDRGALITAGSGSASAPLFRIARAERLRIYVRVPQTWVRALTPGGQAQVLVPEFPARTFLGQVVSTAGALDQASRTLLTEVQIPNDDGSLLPGMFTNVHFAITHAEPPLWLPATALILGAGGMQVAVVRDDQTVHVQTVEVGHDLGQKVEIVAGLTGTESVIVNGGDGLREGLRVRTGE